MVEKFDYQKAISDLNGYVEFDCKVCSKIKDPKNKLVKFMKFKHGSWYEIINTLLLYFLHEKMQTPHELKTIIDTINVVERHIVKQIK